MEKEEADRGGEDEEATDVGVAGATRAEEKAAAMLLTEAAISPLSPGFGVKETKWKNDPRERIGLGYAV
ncbi:hypothetical protein HPP92_004509 [Vanilla planifolia]|uniref:Uncharacterized protein n=1 Tax=Vanilla planifolia TaxID=51239 RepID=A0A835RSC8_VANPL|nr:hypothetical protein HPP92_004509 [Vanilla planifolia]